MRSDTNLYMRSKLQIPGIHLSITRSELYSNQYPIFRMNLKRALDFVGGKIYCPWNIEYYGGEMIWS